MSGRVSTARIVDPRIEPQPNPVYAVTVGPKQNQFYKIPASGLSDSYITFNNLTTLGADRAYLDTFELELTVDITFTVDSGETGKPAPSFSKWTFDSFPFNKCCEEARVNINGGAFFSQPLSYVRAKERYWNEMAINSSYENICPCNKPHMQNELGLQQLTGTTEQNIERALEQYTYMEPEGGGEGFLLQGCALPTRCGAGCNYFMPCASGMVGGWNNSILDENTYHPDTSGNVVVTVTWREPIFASPFSSRIDATYGRPLYNITSMDLAFNMQDLGNMIRVIDPHVTNYNIHISDAQLCYQVMTVPIGLAPSYTVVPYRRFVPYITDGPEPISNTEHVKRTLTSGVYTMNEVPTAIWIFAAPVKATIQSNPNETWNIGAHTKSLWTDNKLFGFMDKISISMANTTQILNTATPLDLYRIAKANGCQDSYNSWGRWNPIIPKEYSLATTNRFPFCGGAGSVLRLIPGTDIILPDQDLIPGSNANNMVFQVSADFDFPPALNTSTRVALWILFEYVGVATITPGQCEITMNPLSDGKSMVNAPVVSATTFESPSEIEGSGWLDKLKSILGVANTIAKKTGVIGTALGMIPGIGSSLQTAARALGYGQRKRPRIEETSGGAVMGLGDFC